MFHLSKSFGLVSETLNIPRFLQIKSGYQLADNTILASNTETKGENKASTQLSE